MLADTHVASFAEVERFAAFRTAMDILRFVLNCRLDLLDLPFIKGCNRLVGRRKFDAFADDIRTGNTFRLCVLECGHTVDLCELLDELFVRNTVLQTGADTAAECIAVRFTTGTNRADEHFHRFSVNRTVYCDIEPTAP